MIPLYGFLEGDVLGLLVFAADDDTAADVAARLVTAASIRVAPPASPVVVHNGVVVPPEMPIARAGFEALDRFDVVSCAGRAGRGTGP